MQKMSRTVVYTFAFCVALIGCQSVDEKNSQSVAGLSKQCPMAGKPVSQLKKSALKGKGCRLNGNGVREQSLNPKAKSVPSQCQFEVIGHIECRPNGLAIRLKNGMLVDLKGMGIEL